MIDDLDSAFTSNISCIFTKKSSMIYCLHPRSPGQNKACKILPATIALSLELYLGENALFIQSDLL